MSSENPACITVKKTDLSEVDMPKGAEAIFDLMAGAFVVSVHLCLSLSLSLSLSLLIFAHGVLHIMRRTSSTAYTHTHTHIHAHVQALLDARCAQPRTS